MYVLVYCHKDRRFISFLMRLHKHNGFYLLLSICWFLVSVFVVALFFRSFAKYEKPKRMMRAKNQYLDRHCLGRGKAHIFQTLYFDYHLVLNRIHVE